MTEPLAALEALRAEYPGVYYWQDPRWGDAPLGEVLAATPPAIDPKRLARALADWFSTALLDQDFRGYRRWSALANEAVVAIIAAYEAEMEEGRQQD